MKREEGIKIYHLAREKWKIDQEGINEARREGILEAYRELKNMKFGDVNLSPKTQILKEMVQELIEKCKQHYGENLGRLKYAKDSEINNLYQVTRDFVEKIAQDKKQEREVSENQIDTL